MSILLMCAGGIYADQTAGKAVVELGSNDAISVAEGEMFTFPLSVSSEVPLAGAQFRLSFDTGTMVPREPVLTSRSKGMTLVHAVNGNEMIILVFSAEGEQIAPGSGPVLSIPCTFKGDKRSSFPISIEEVVLANAEAQAVSAVVRTTTLSDWKQTPTQFHLSQNYPNPFNPVTDIRYQITDSGSPVHTTLKIYNILGQGVRTLVDEPKHGGYYTVTWNGMDNSGFRVASGVYFYRLASGDYVDTRSMLLLK